VQFSDFFIIAAVATQRAPDRLQFSCFSVVFRPIQFGALEPSPL
jgi:hypothetical protein